MTIMSVGNFYIVFSGLIASLIVLWTKPLHIRHTSKGHTALARQSSHRLPPGRCSNAAPAAIGGSRGAGTVHCELVASKHSLPAAPCVISSQSPRFPPLRGVPYTACYTPPMSLAMRARSHLPRIPDSFF